MSIYTSQIKLKHITLNVKYGPELEIARIRHQNRSGSFFPDDDCVLENFDKKEYETIIKEKIIPNKSKLEKYYLILENIFKLNKKIFNIHLHKYGTTGSATGPYDIEVRFTEDNFEIRDRRLILGIICHETFHSYDKTYKYYNKHTIRPGEHERLVDYALQRKPFKFLNYRPAYEDKNKRHMYKGADHYIDELFNMYFYTDLEKFYNSVEAMHK